MAHYYYRDPRSAAKGGAEQDAGTMIELKLVMRIRERLAAWRAAGWPGATRTTLELLAYWSREGRQQPLFFAQREAAESRRLGGHPEDSRRSAEDPARGAGGRAHADGIEHMTRDVRGAHLPPTSSAFDYATRSARPSMTVASPSVVLVGAAPARRRSAS